MDGYTSTDIAANNLVRQSSFPQTTSALSYNRRCQRSEVYADQFSHPDTGEMSRALQPMSIIEGRGKSEE